MSGDAPGRQPMRTLLADTLVLEPLLAAHAEDMFALLSDAELHRHLDRPPPASVEHLRSVYARLESRRSPDGSQHWLNWIVRPAAGPAPIGFVQATVTGEHEAWVAYVLSRPHWGRGHATRATRCVMEHLQSAYGVRRFLATVEAANARSIGVLERLDFRAASPAEAGGHSLAPTERLFLAEAAARPARLPRHSP